MDRCTGGIVTILLAAGCRSVPAAPGPAIDASRAESRPGSHPPPVRDDDAASVWIVRLDHPDPAVRGAAIEALSMLGRTSPDTIEQVIRRMNAPCGTHAALALVGIGPPAVGRLIQLLGHEAAGIRYTAAWTLAEMGARAAEAAPALAETLWDRDLEIAWKAAQALVAMGPSAAGAVRRLATAVTDPAVHREARSCLIAVFADLGPAAEAAMPQLLRLRENEELWEGAAEALGAIGAPALPHLLLLLRAEAPADCRFAAEALGAMGPTAADALPDLIPLLRHADVDVCVSALQAIGAMGSAAAPAASELIASLQTAAIPEDTLEILVAIGPPALPALAQALATADERLRPHLERAIQRIRAEERAGDR